MFSYILIFLKYKIITGKYRYTEDKTLIQQFALAFNISCLHAIKWLVLLHFISNVKYKRTDALSLWHQQ